MTAALLITDNNLSYAWARTFLSLMTSSGGMRYPAIITIDGIDSVSVLESDDVRKQLGVELEKRKLASCSTVASTIFPTSMWNASSQTDASILFSRYEKAWPKISRCRANRNGVYFRRLTSFSPAGFEGYPVNQLKFIADTYASGNHRKSALQAAILDPTRDHTNNHQKGFPCLQQIAFTPLHNGRLSVTGYYATQYHFEKAYGNYLGLYWLGRFMAKQLGLQLSQVVCVASMLRLGNTNKAQLRKLESALQAMIETR